MKALVTDETSVATGTMSTGALTPPAVRHVSGPPDQECQADTALLRAGILAFGGPIGPTALHAHHTVQIVATCTPVTVVDASGIRHHGTHVIVPADAPHRIAAGADRGTAIYLDPETAAGAAADRRAHAYGWADSIHSLPVDPSRGALADVVADVVRDLQHDTADSTDTDQHDVVTEAMRLLPSLVRNGPVRGADVARLLGVSANRLTRLFTEQVGIPLRPYVLWLRLHVAITQVRSGDDLAAAAHAAGFADSTQFTRTCRRTFGLAPTELSHTAQWDLGERP
jgi:AraC-like DNA-binding protein